MKVYKTYYPNENMPKKDDSTGENIVSELGNWNVASDFARIKIMIPLAKCDYYEDIAKFGTESIIDELMGYEIPNDIVRYTGLKRLVNELLRVCKNAKFAMKKAKTKEDIVNYENKLKQIIKVLPNLITIRSNNINKTRQVLIDQDKFDKTFDIILEIKSSINFPLNQNHLIFTDKEEFDIHSYKKSMKERMISKG